jgi:hypothetical protein
MTVQLFYFSQVFFCHVPPSFFVNDKKEKRKRKKKEICGLNELHVVFALVVNSPHQITVKKTI